MVSALLGFMAVSGVLGKTNLEKLELRLELPEELYDGVQTLATLHLANRRRLPAFLLHIFLLDSDSLVVLVPRQSEVRHSLRLIPRGRGLQRVEQAVVRSAFPVNFFVRARRLPLEQDILVLPRPRPCPATAFGHAERGGGERPARGRGQGGELQRIADYSGREPLKLIHWKLSARHDELKVKELAPTAREPILLDLERLPGRNVEERLGSAAWLVNRHCRDGRPVGLRIHDRTLPPATGRPHRLRLLQELALYGQD
ncbi:DUF58 domain-containing protein [Desulfuromonas sp.]|uniref:DUF58 domain-containing protein n=1 Tax=Desulfuromonas sp. TaxID=892 RepID=UPI0025C5AE39|nr:DUF58 domain-containing protein [Desulfuromonas sp.]